jgi:GNAT superfamily N-acetyltransferase
MDPYDMKNKILDIYSKELSGDLTPLHMPDLLVKLYELPDTRPQIDALRSEGVNIRKAMVYEKLHVVRWVTETFGAGWASECDVAFSNHPATCFIATGNNKIGGFACYDSTAKNFFGPMGVAEQARNRGVGSALLLSCLHAMASDGYAYAIIGGTDNVEFYSKAAGAVEIPGSSPGIYRDRLK